MARIAAVAQALDVLSCAYNLEAAYEILAKRSGAMYDPEAVKAALSLRGDARFWDRVRKQPRSTLLSVDLPINKQVAEVKEVNAICESYAAVIDAKSSYTNQHSLRVRQYAVEIGKALGLPFESLHTLSQAALLHDVGKLSVPNTILEKPNALTEQEWIRVRRYPAHTHGILKRISGFERLTRIACTHNERLNGTGYFQGLSANKLDLEMRIIAVADVFDALSTDRPHREALSLKRILRLLDAQSEVSLDGACIDVLKSKYCYHTLAELSGRRRPAQHAA